MARAGPVAKNTWRNQHRRVPRIPSIALSILRLALMMARGRSLYVDQWARHLPCASGGTASAPRLSERWGPAISIDCPS